MALRELLLETKAALAQRWFRRILDTYAPDARPYVAKHTDRFANPLGHTLVAETSALVTAVLEASEPEAACAHLEKIIKIRSLQDCLPSQAVVFTLLLKDAIREELGDKLQDATLRSELADIDAQIDRLTLFAFDIYTRCREQMYELRVNEIKRRVSGVLRREGLSMDDPLPEPDVTVARVRRLHPRKGSVQ
jgi:hypothetical protein